MIFKDEDNLRNAIRWVFLEKGRFVREEKIVRKSIEIGSYGISEVNANKKSLFNKYFSIREIKPKYQS